MTFFNSDNERLVREVISRYPRARSAAIPLLHLAQEQEGWITREAMVQIADLTGSTPAEVLGTGSFYEMFKFHPVGRYMVNVCTNISCLLLGGEELLEHVESTLGVRSGGTTDDGLFTVEEAENGQEGLDKCAEGMPDVVLLDVRMPKRTGIEACKAIKEAVPSAKIIMLTVSDEEADLYEAVKSGAAGYLLKDSSIEEVAQAVRVVADGQSLISPSMAVKLIDEFKQMSKPEREHMPGLRLTERELEVLRLVATGKNNREIAKDLFISENTVKNHVRNILEKLQLHSRMEAVMYAVKEKLLDLP